MPDHDLMTTFPAAGESLVTLENWRTPPYNRWAFQHVSELIPTAPIWRGTGPVWNFPRAAEDLSDIVYRDHAGAEFDGRRNSSTRPRPTASWCCTTATSSPSSTATALPRTGRTS